MISFKGYLGNYHGTWEVDDHGSVFFILSEPIWDNGRWDKGWYMGERLSNYTVLGQGVIYADSRKEQKEILSEIRTIEEFDSWLAFVKKQKEKYAAG